MRSDAIEFLITNRDQLRLFREDSIDLLANQTVNIGFVDHISILDEVFKAGLVSQSLMETFCVSWIRRNAQVIQLVLDDCIVPKAIDRRHLPKPDAVRGFPTRAYEPDGYSQFRCGPIQLPFRTGPVRIPDLVGRLRG